MIRQSNFRNAAAGFTLVEIALVLVIVSILLGFTVALFPLQQELKQYRNVNAEIDRIVDSIIGFAQVNGRLPCPDTDGDSGSDFAVSGVLDGFEDTADNVRNFPDGGAGTSWTDDDDPGDANFWDGIVDGCLAFSGFLPARTLGINGNIDNNTGLLLDPWGEPYRYAVSNIDTDFNGDGNDGDNDIGIGLDFVTPNGIRHEGIANVSGDLFICTDSDTLAANDLDCGDVSGDEVTSAAAMILSTGKDAGGVASNIQQENTDDFHDGSNDKVYISSPRIDATGSEYDDVVRWISTNQLFTKMIQAGRLP